MPQHSVLLLLLAALSLNGCAALNFRPAPEQLKHDLGPLPDTSNDTLFVIDGGLRIGAVNAPTYLHNANLHYRQLHEAPYTRHVYGYSQWTAPIAGLLQQRLYALLAPRISNGVSQPLASTRDQFRLEVNLIEFIQEFSSDEAATVMLQLEIQLIDRVRGQVIAHRSMKRSEACATADVQGGVAALVKLTNAALQDIAEWVPQQLASGMVPTDSDAL